MGLLHGQKRLTEWLWQTEWKTARDCPPLASQYPPNWKSNRQTNRANEQPTNWPIGIAIKFIRPMGKLEFSSFFLLEAPKKWQNDQTQLLNWKVLCISTLIYFQDLKTCISLSHIDCSRPQPSSFVTGASFPLWKSDGTRLNTSIVSCKALCSKQSY